MVKRIKEYVKYSLKELEEYTKTEGSCLNKVNSILHIGFPPHGFGNFKENLQKIVANEKIGYFDNKLNGIILDVRNIKVFGNFGVIRHEDPIVHFNIQANCYVFQPKIGSIVRGQVKHISTKGDHIGVIIYRVFSVSIKLKRNIRTNIALESEIEFRIKNLDLKSTMPFIEGELLAKEEKPLKNHLKSEVDSDDDESSSEENFEQDVAAIIRQLNPHISDDEYEDLPNNQNQSTESNKEIRLKKEKEINNVITSLATERNETDKKKTLQHIPLKDIKTELIGEPSLSKKSNKRKKISDEQNTQKSVLQNENSVTNLKLENDIVHSVKSKKLKNKKDKTEILFENQFIKTEIKEESQTEQSNDNEFDYVSPTPVKPIKSKNKRKFDEITESLFTNDETSVKFSSPQLSSTRIESPRKKQKLKE